jgi:sigma54-dependent transcription regulator
MAVTITNKGLHTLATVDASSMDLRQAVFTGTVPAAATIDPMGATSEDEFNAMSFDERVALCQQTMDSNQ